MHTALRAAAAGLALLLAPPAGAQAYPDKPVRIIVPFPPGATIDFLARLLAQKLGEDWGVNVFVENKSGAGGIVGIDAAAKSMPDGYTFVCVANSFAANPVLRKDLPYDTFKDLAPVTLVGVTPHVLVAFPALPANTVTELVAYAKQQPGKVTYASFGSGTTPHLAGETLKSMAGIDIVHVPYRGQIPALADVMAGQVSMTFGNLPDVMPQVAARKLKALAIATLQRSALAPELPTLGEAGLPGFTSDSWFGIAAPAKTPPAAVRKMQTQVADILRRPDVKSRLHTAGVEPSGNTPEQFGTFLQEQMAKYAAIIKAAGIKAE
ncbi:MAG: tripartite tricarboxylate transporter substrate binding protein [Betaproteobacteria bacterium]|nr:tripartite tricarboxylate transporter substrate binding protein [Betaproteobacteria bacterium]